MDTYCHRCGEPWEIDTFHEVAAELGTTFDKVLALFQQKGCAVITAAGPCENTAGLRGEAVSMLNELLGDDIDGIASMMDDFEYLGMLE